MNLLSACLFGVVGLRGGAARGRAGAGGTAGVVRPRTGVGVGRLVVLAGAACTALALGAGPASAHVIHNFESSFPVQAAGGPQGTPASDAFDQASGNVWVLDATNQTVDEFGPDGTYEGVQITGPETPAGSFGLQFFNGVAVDNSGGANAGDVYVADWGNGVVDKFDSHGNYLCQITGRASATTTSPSECAVTSGVTSAGAPQGGVGPSGLVVDASGNLWVADLANAALDEFGPSGNFITQVRDPNIQNPAEIGLDQAGNLYATNYCSDVVKFTGGSFAGVVDANCPVGLAVDPSSNHIYASDSQTSGQIVEYDSAGNQVSTFAAQSGLVLGGAVRPSTGELYADDWNNGAIDRYTGDLVVPDVTTGQASSVTQTSATLSGTVNPAGEQLTDCHFEIGDTFTSPSSEQSLPCVPAAGQIPADSANHAVSADVSSVAAGRSYHFRLVAANANGTTTGSWAGFTTLPSTTAQSCPNAQFRTGDSAKLPDCRAYETVTPANIPDGADVVGLYAWPDGSHAYYTPQIPFTANATNGDFEAVLATRTASGWQGTGISPPEAGPGQTVGAATELISQVAISSDFSTALVDNPFDDDPLDQDNGAMDVYSIDLASSSVSLVSRPDTGPMTAAVAGGKHNDISPPGAYLAGAAADGSEVFFETNGQVPVAPGTTADTRTPGPAAGDELYERANEHTYLVGILPDGSVPACGAHIANGVPDSFNTNQAFTYAAVAPDGSNVLFDANDCSSSGLYLRDLVHGISVHVPGNSFTGRTVDGSKIFTGNLAEFDVNSHQLTDIGSGQLLASSDDGSRVYYLGSDNALHLWDNGTTTMIPGTDAGGYSPGWVAGSLGFEVPVASPDGSNFLFIDAARLTGYDNQGAQEAYLYQATSNSTICVSCNPSGAAPQGSAELLDQQRSGNNDPLLPETMPLVSRDGKRAVFETTDTLLPQDHNPPLQGSFTGSPLGMDVYEWEAHGTGSCQDSSVSGGCLYLLSSGRAGAATYLAGASADLRDVYIETSDQLLPGMDGAFHIYDARIDGGFAAASEPAPCSGDACRGPVSGAPVLPTAASVTFAGPGNTTPASPSGSVRVIHETVNGMQFVLSVNVPGRGTIVVSSGAARTVHKTVTHAGTYKVTLSLTPRARRALRRSRRLKVAVRVNYTPADGPPSTAAVTTTLIAPRKGRR